MTPCPACAHTIFEKLIDFGIIPKSGVFLDSPTASFPTIHLAFAFCAACGLLRQETIGSQSHDYSLVSRTTTRNFPKYTPQIVRSLHDSGIATDDLILEIGSNDGGFLQMLADSGFAGLVGIEPSISCSENSRRRGHTVVTAHWDAATAESVLEKFGPARAIVCRHTLEHVPDPLGFLKAIRSILAPDGIAFIEVPDARPITHSLHGHELWDEHLHIFTEANLRLILHAAGFETTLCNAWPERSDVNLLLWAKPSPHPASPPPSIPQNELDRDLALCREFETRWQSFSTRLRTASTHWPRPAVMLGASHPQTNFLHFTGLQGAIDAFVDDNPSKQSAYIPLTRPTPIIPASALATPPAPATIFRGAFGYNDWMDRAIASLASKSTLNVNPYEELLAAETTSV
jgi:SAM-dependent methyltransferase